MKSLYKSILLPVILLSLLFTLPVNAADTIVVSQSASKSIKLIINGEEIKNLPMPPVIYNNSTLVPAREVFEPLGAVVDWKPARKEIYVGTQDDLLILQIGNKFADFNGELMEMSIPPQIINGKTMIPLRFVAETFGYEVEWSDSKRAAYVNTKQPQPTPEPTQTPRPTPAPTPTPVATPTPTTTPGTTPVTPAVDMSPGVFSEQVHPETNINNLTLPNSSSTAFVIQATSPISKIKKTLMPDNRLILDIYNANMGLSKSSYNVNNGLVGQVRVSQFQTEPEKVARIVFDLNSGVKFNTVLSADRQRLSLDFESNTVLDVNFSSNGTDDYIDITFQSSPSVNTSYLLSPERVVVDAVLSKINNPAENPVNGRFAKTVRSAQFNDNTARIVIDLKQTTKHTVSINGNIARITLSQPTYRNIKYNPDNYTITIDKASASNLNANQIQHKDLYLDGQYKLTLPGDYSNLLGYGDYMIGHGDIKSVNIQTNQGQTVLTINESKILTFSVTDEGDKILIKRRNPKDVYDKIVVLDPGHGGNDPGSLGHGLQEKNITTDIVNRLKNIIEAEGKIKVYLTRYTDVYVEHMVRVNVGEQVGDMFISVHNNAAKDNPVANGTETYYYPHANDNEIGISTKQMADVIHRNLMESIQTNDRKVKTNSYIVIKYNTIPSVLIETAFITNPDDAALLGSPEFREKAAKGIYNGIKEIFNNYDIKRK